MKFSQIPYDKPNANKLLKEIDKAIIDFKAATCAQQQFKIYDYVDNIFDDFITQYSIVRIRSFLNTSDEFYAKESAELSKQYAALSVKYKQFSLLVVHSPYKEELSEKICYVTLKNLELYVKATSQETIEDVQQENLLVKEYTKLMSNLCVEFDKKTIPLTMLAPYKEHTDRNTRKAALIAEGNCYKAVKGQLDDIFDKLVKLRTTQAKKLGFNNFIELGYARVTRNCYTKTDVAFFRNEVVNNIVPIVTKIRQSRKERLSLDKIEYYDLALTFKDGSPRPHVFGTEIIDNAKTMFSEMNESARELINLLIDNELYDVESRIGKAPGGFCAYFDNYKYPFIFANFNNTSSDVYVFIHEMGHALAKYFSSKQKQYASQSMDISEMHSMTMEFLATPWYELFFKQDTKKYNLAHAEDAIIFLPYACLVDEFQETIYNEPDMTPKERDEKWLELERKYRPDISFNNMPFYCEGAGWQRQTHIFKSPFYYIDYALAQVMALQMFSLFLKDKNKAIELYFNILKIGSNKTFIDLIKHVGLSSPFSKGTITQISCDIINYISEIKI